MIFASSLLDVYTSIIDNTICSDCILDINLPSLLLISDPFISLIIRLTCDFLLFITFVRSITIAFNSSISSFFNSRLLWILEDPIILLIEENDILPCLDDDPSTSPSTSCFFAELDESKFINLSLISTSLSFLCFQTDDVDIFEPIPFISDPIINDLIEKSGNSFSTS